MTQSKTPSETPADKDAKGAPPAGDKPANGAAAAKDTRAAKTAAPKTETVKSEPAKSAAAKSEPVKPAAKETPATATAAAKTNGSANGAATATTSAADKPADKPAEKAADKSASTGPAPRAANGSAGSGGTDGLQGAADSPLRPRPHPAPTQEEPSGRSGVSTLMLVIAAALGAAIVAFLMRGGSVEPDAAQLARLSALEARLDGIELGTTDPAVASGIRQEIEQLKTRITEVESLRRQVARLGTGTGTTTSGIAPGADTDIAALEGGVTEINDAIQRLQTRMAQFSGEVTRNEARLEGRLDTLEAALPADLNEQITALGTRVVALEDNDVARDAHRAAQAVALANLSRAAQSTGPFRAELEALQVLVPADPLVTSISGYAGEGLPSVAILKRRFDRVSRDIVRADRATEDAGVMGQLWANLAASVSVRPTGEAAGEGTFAVLARTEGHLEEDNLRAAVSELGALDGEAATAAGPWLAQAQARLHLDQLVSELNTRVITGISADAQAVTTAPIEQAPVETAPAPAAAPLEEPVVPAEDPAPAAPEEAPAAGSEEGVVGDEAAGEGAADEGPSDDEAADEGPSDQGTADETAANDGPTPRPVAPDGSI